MLTLQEVQPKRTQYRTVYPNDTAHDDEDQTWSLRYICHRLAPATLALP